IANDARTILIGLAHAVGLIAGEAEHALRVLAEIKENVAGAGRRRAAPHGCDGAERRAAEADEIRVMLKAARHRRARAALAGLLKAGVDENRAPWIAEAPAFGQLNETLNAAIDSGLVKAAKNERNVEP